MKPRKHSHVEESLFEIVAHVETDMETRLSGYASKPKVEPSFDWEGVRLNLTPFLYVQLAPPLAHKLSHQLREGLLNEYPWFRPEEPRKPSARSREGARPRKRRST